jgi:hypothetical protein
MEVVRTAIGRTLSQLAKAQTRLRRIEPSLDTDAFVPMQGLAPGNGVGWPSSTKRPRQRRDQRPRRLPLAQSKQPRGPGFRVSARSQSVIDGHDPRRIARAGLWPSRRRTSIGGEGC